MTDNHIDTNNSVQPKDRKKREVNDESTEIDLPKAEALTFDVANKRDNRNKGDGKRSTRQLRPIGHNPWQYSTNFDLGNGRDQDINVNYNTFLTPPSSRSNHFFKGSSSVFYQLPLSESSKSPRAHYSSLGNVYSSSIRNPSNANTVTEFSSHKPFTPHTSFNPSDARTHLNLKQTNFGTTGTFVPLILHNNHNEQQKSYSKPLPPLNDNLPENFAYYHIGNSATRDPFQPILSTPRPIQQQLSIQPSPRLPSPQAPVYYIDKPSKAVIATTPKNQYVQFSTVGGFYNNNPTAFPLIDGSKKHKNRPSPDKYETVAHRPSYQDEIVSTATPTPNNREVNKNAETYYRIHEAVTQKYFHPEEVRPKVPNRPTYLKPASHENKPSKNPLYTYDITTDEVKIPLQQKKPNLYLTQTQRDKDTNHHKVISAPNYVKHLTGEKRPASTIGPHVGIDFDFNRFIHNIRESQQNKLKPPSAPKQHQQQIHQLHKEVFPSKFTSSTISDHSTKAETTTLNSDDYYYYDSEEEVKPTITTKRQPPVTERYTSTTMKAATSSIAAKPYKETFINSFKHNDGNKYTLKGPSATNTPDQEYFEYEEDDEPTNDEEPEFHYKLPPQNVSKFMPMSETAAPRPASMITTTTYRPPLSSHATQKIPNRHQLNKAVTPSTVPAIIKFPDGIFETIQPMHHGNRFENQSALRQFTRNRGQVSDTNLTTKLHTKPTKSTQSITQPTKNTTTQQTTTPIRTYTFRPSGKTRGQTSIPIKSKWNATKAPKLQQPQRPNSLKKNLWDIDERLPNRYFPKLKKNYSQNFFLILFFFFYCL